MNSVLQGLYYCQSFRTSILESNNENSDVNSIILFQDLFQKLSGQSASSLHGATRSIVQYLKINPMIQEDAQEFYLKLLDSFNKDTPSSPSHWGGDAQSRRPSPTSNMNLFF